MKLIKRSDYKMVGQLHQTPLKISILSLLLKSEAQEALLNVLNQAHVTQSIIVDQFDGVVSNITPCINLSFNDEELPPEGRDHNRPLHIFMKCLYDVLVWVFIDTSLSLNLVPKSTLAKCPFEEKLMNPSALVVKTFDGSRRPVIGEEDIPMQIALHVFYIPFQVVDKNLAYSRSLGRSWIHVTDAFTSTLPQKMKFVVKDKLIIVSGEEDVSIIHLSSF